MTSLTVNLINKFCQLPNTVLNARELPCFYSPVSVEKMNVEEKEEDTRKRERSESSSDGLRLDLLPLILVESQENSKKRRISSDSEENQGSPTSAVPSLPNDQGDLVGASGSPCLLRT